MKIRVFSLALLLASCTRGTAFPPHASPSPSAVQDYDCLGAAPDATRVQFGTADGLRLRGVAFGTGPRGVVLAHQRNADLCSWAPFARRLVARGFHVLAFNARGYGSSQGSVTKPWRLDLDIEGAISELHILGAARSCAVGASMGGTGVLVAGAARSAPACVASLSGPATFMELNAGASIRKVKIPILLVAAGGDEPYVSDARALHARVPSSTLLIVPGAAHGVALVPDMRVRDALERFLAHALSR